MTDPIADLLTRIRNGLKAKFVSVSIPHSGVKHEVVRVLYEEGFVSGYKIGEAAEGGIKVIEVALKYVREKTPVISNLKRVSRPGSRVYWGYRNIKPVRNGLGLTIFSTSKGVLTDSQAREQKVGGEPLCTIW